MFGRFADTVERTSKRAAEKFGLSANEYRENANLIGSLFKNQGVEADKLAGKTRDMIGVGSDLAATFGGTTKEAVEALGSAFKGEFDPLERYGISLKASSISALLAKRGQDKLTGATAKLAQQQAVSDLIMQQSKDSVGAFGRESNTLAGQQQRLSAKVENLRAKLGTKLLPILTTVVAWLSTTGLPMFERFGKRLAEDLGPAVKDLARTFTEDVLPVLKDLGTFLVETVLPVLVKLGTWIGEHIEPLATLAGVVGTVVAAMRVWKAVTSAFTAVQAALNVVMALNPIGLVVIALVALVAALVIAYKKSEKFRAVVDKVWGAVKGAAKKVWEWLTVTIPEKAKALFDGIKRWLGQIPEWIGEKWAAVKSRTREAWAWIRDKIVGAVVRAWTAVRDKFRQIVGKVTGLKDAVTGAVRGAGSWLRETGVNLIEGLWDGIKGMGSWIAGKITGFISEHVPGPVKKVLGIASPSKLFRQFGKWTTEGLALGMRDKAGLASKAAGGLAGAVADGFEAPRLRLEARPRFEGAAATHAATPRTFQISVDVAPGGDPVEVGRAVVDAISAFENAGGRKRA